MFKIESYITPIILNHVAKYVKNIRPQDAQVSLWGGEVAFQNLDLRLDVLENELQLPFEFLSGHIHELTIHVPWTKIASEPITITINTIEFVLKLKDKNSEPVPNVDRRKKVSRIEDTQPGYVPTLVNKVAHNISINCHNIILKYVEEDIVVSMNVQLLSFSSADENWKSAFIDINPTKLLLRKLVQISDLTICLDKRNSAGKIDVCQEPILYRCSLEVRIMRKYNAATAAYTSTTRIDVFSKAMDINISSQQFPMAMRLFILMMTLKDGKLKLKSDESILSEYGPDSEQRNDNNESYLAWAWNLIPSIFPEDTLYEENEEQSGHYLDSGIYIGSLKVTLKSSEMFADSIVQSTKKIRYKPIFKASFKGIFSETLIVGNRWFNMKAGISHMTVEPLGSFAKNSSPSENLFVVTDTQVSETYFNESLFDSNSLENCGRTKKYCPDWDTHMGQITAEYLRFRAPAMAIDLTHFTDIPDNMNISSESGVDLETATVQEKVLMRLFLSSTKIKYNSNLIHIIETVLGLASAYDYSPYVEEKRDMLTKLPPPSMDDYEALMSNIPRRTIELTLDSIIFEMHPKTKFNPSEGRSSDPFEPPLYNVPFITVDLKFAKLKQTSPIYPNRLVHTTCQLPEKPIELVEACYERSEMNIQNVKFSTSEKSGLAEFLTIPNASASYATLLQPNLWTDDDIPKMKCDLLADSIQLLFNRPQQLVAFNIANTIFLYNKNALHALVSSSAKKDMHDTTLPRLELRLSSLYGMLNKYDGTICSRGRLNSVRGYLTVAQSDTVRNTTEADTKYLVLSAPLQNMKTFDKIFLQWIIQVPENYDKIKHTPVISATVANSVLILDPLLTQFLQYEEGEIAVNDERDKSFVPEPLQGNESETRSSKKSVISERPSKRIIQPEETIHMSSDKVEKVELPHDKKDTKSGDIPLLFNLIGLLKCLILNVHVQQCSVLIPNASLVSTSRTFDVEQQSNNIDMVLIKLPDINCKSSYSREINNFEQTFPIGFTTTMPTKEKDLFPWTCSITELTGTVTQNGAENLFLNPQQTNITVAINHKKDSPNNVSLALNLHIDTTPIVIRFSEKEVILLHEAMNAAFNFSELLSVRNKSIEKPKKELPRIVTIAEDDSHIKEFLGMNSESNINTENTESLKEKSGNYQFSTWLQWTVTKLTVNLEGKSPENNEKLVVEIEDFITSIDQQNVYFKLKSKIGTLSAQYYEYNASEWIANESLKLSVRPEANEAKSNDTYLDFTITRAETSNVFKKLGAQTKIRNLQQCLTEVMITSQAIDVCLDLDRFAAFVPVLCAFGRKGTYNDAVAKGGAQESIISVDDLPLVYVESKGFTAYIPVQTKYEWCNVLIFKVDSIKVIPNVENPLSRNPIRTDVYTKAAQMRILNMHGSKIEDRQYELIVNNISALTSSWSEILSYMKENTEHSHMTNPAFEWNRQSKKMPIEFDQIFNNFTISLTYAPHIVYKSILISGESIELNCVSDLIATMTIEQVIMINTIWKMIEKFTISKDLSSESVLTENMVCTTANITTEKMKSSAQKCENLIKLGSRYQSMVRINKFTRGDRYSAVATSTVGKKLPSDSGIVSYAISDHLDAGAKRKKPIISGGIISNQADITFTRNIPFDMSFVAGIFLFKLYQTQHRRKRKGNESEQSTVIPLVAVTFTQPSMLVSQGIYERTHKISLFNLGISFGCNSEDDDKLNNEFNNVMFETRRGHLDSAGIPQPLVFIKHKQGATQRTEAEINISRPIKLFISHKILERLLTIRTLLQDVVTVQYQKTTIIPKPIIRSTKINMLKKVFFGADSIKFFLDQAHFEYKPSNQYNLNISLCKMSTTLLISERPEKVTSQVIVQSFLINTEKRILLHPVTLKLDAGATQESWYKIPIAWCRCKTNVVQVDIGPENLITLTQVYKSIEAILQSFGRHWTQLDEAMMYNRPNNLLINREKFSEIVLPEPKARKTVLPTEEFYQDDLRAGAFQFIEIHGENTLPLPYQIQIIIKENGIVCWRYPQPRAICKLQIFPVLLQTTTPVKIKCRLEYFNEPHNDFLPYCEFYLSDNKTETVELPERKVTAYIWRVLILQSFVLVDGRYFEESTSSEEEESENISKIENEESASNVKDYKLHPKALLACMRIDTTFNPRLIPKAQFVIEVAFLQLNFQNQYKMKDCILPERLRHFKLSSSCVCAQTFATIVCSNIKMHGSILDEMASTFNVEFCFVCKILDYSFFNMLNLIDQTAIRVSVDISDSINVRVACDAIRLNFGPCVAQALVASENIWEQVLFENAKELVVASRFIVCNCTIYELWFGQAGSVEQQVLNGGEFMFYSFRSDHLRQELVFSIPHFGERISEPVALHKEGLHYIKIDAFALIIQIEKCSSTQFSILVRGQIEFISMSVEEFHVQYRLGELQVSGSAHKKVAIHFSLKRKGRTSLTVENTEQKESFIRLRLADGNKRNGWSGDVPLKTNGNSPWLVKVPIQDSGKEYVSFWVRMVVEDIVELKRSGLDCRRYLVVIWPIYVIRSMLTTPIKVTEVECGTEYTVAGKGALKELSVSGTHETEHEVIFKKDFVSPNEEDKGCATLSYKMIDWKQFFTIDKSYNSIETMVNELVKLKAVSWPCSSEDELRCSRDLSRKEKTTPIYRYLPSRQLSCSLMLDITPWCLFINAIGVPVRVETIELENRTINPNQLSMLPMLKDVFTIDIQFDTKWFCSQPICIQTADGNKQVRKDAIVLLENGSVELQIYPNNESVSRLLLTATNENGLKVIKLSSVYVISNFSTHDLKFFPFVLGRDDKTDKRSLVHKSLNFKKDLPKAVQKPSELSPKGIAIDNFCDISSNVKKKPTITNLIFFLAISYDCDTEIACPLPLHKLYNRKCFSIYNGSKTIALAASVFEYNKFFYINIYDDPCPAVELDNQTELTLFVGQPESFDTTRPVKVVSEFDGNNFEWYQILNPRSKLLYSPPDVYVNFPEIENHQCNLSLAHVNDNNQVCSKLTTRWTKPFRANVEKTKLLNIPLYGDLKLNISDKKKIIKISILYVSQESEFSVKDLRTRLLNPNITDTLLSEDKSQQTQLEESKTTQNRTDSDTIVVPLLVEENKSLPIKFSFFSKELKLCMFVDQKEKVHEKKELFSLDIDNLLVLFDTATREAELIIPNLQIDNQLYSMGNYDFPVILCAQSLYTAKEFDNFRDFTSNQDFLKSIRDEALIYIRVNLIEENYEMESVYCKLKPLRVYIEDSYMNDLFYSLEECDPQNSTCIPAALKTTESCLPGHLLLPKEVVNQALCLAYPIRLKSVIIEPISILLSLHTSVRLYLALDHSPLDFSTYERKNILTLPWKFGHTLGRHYLSGALFGAGWLVGSLEILGSPSGLARSLTSGLKDFVSMPFQGLLRGPWGFIIGITQGSASLLRNITAGTVNSVTKLAASFARNIDRLTLDEDHFQRTEALRRCRPQGFTEGFAQGLTGLGISLLGAVGGLARHPLEATSPVGIFTGVGRGIVGAFTKPISGAAELVALTGQGVLQSVGFNAMPKQKSVMALINKTICPAESKISCKLLPSSFSADQVLFFHEASLIRNNELKRVIICLTVRVFIIFDLEGDKLFEIVPVQKIEAIFDDLQDNLLNIKVLSSEVDNEELENQFLNTRILNFLRDSNDHIPAFSPLSLEHILEREVHSVLGKKYDAHWSFYINPQLGSHLLHYLQLINWQFEQDLTIISQIECKHTHDSDVVVP